MIKYGIDIDGILADFTSAMVKVLNKHFNTSLPSSFVPSDWGWQNANLKPGVFNDAWKIIYETENFWYSLDTLPVIETMRTYFNKYADVKYEFYFITSRRDTVGWNARLQSENWLYDVLGNPDQTINVLVAPNPMDKVDVLHALKIDYSIDDHTPTVVNASSLHNHKAYLLSQPWNGDSASYKIRIVRSLEEFFLETENN